MRIELVIGSPVVLAPAGVTIKDALELRLRLNDTPVDWIDQGTYEKTISAVGQSANAAWLKQAERQFQHYQSAAMTTWLASTPHLLVFIWTAQNGADGHPLPMFDAMALQFQCVSDAVRFKLTF